MTLCPIIQDQHHRASHVGTRVLRVMVLLLGLIAHGAPALAQSDAVADDADAREGVDGEPAADARPGDEPRPWVEGVPLDTRLRADRIFREGNVLIKEGLFARAAARYQEAIALWDHPVFHYNLAIAQINLDQPIGAYQSFQRALRYDGRAIGADRSEQAESFLTLLGNQLAQVEVTCDEPGARVTLDGKALFIGPGRHQGLVLPGGHQVVASAPGRIPATEQIVLAPGERTAIALALQRPVRTVTERYMPAWIPWASLGLGAAVLGVGGYMDRKASDALAGFDADFNRRCPRGCTEIEAPGFDARLARIGRDQAVARGLYAAGGAVVMVSAALLYVNRERVVRRTDGDTVSVMPLAGPEALGLTARVRF